ncbi:hypothetical protein LSUB1_G007229 [Lachnellula subtilissima]|uniref:F-box domain-containing protein n=1 Tax=Lachnellula subtilissima TaxID=602034 RepID=A0A8H8RMF7_9HELO|nr:hypothetical protein LSUB1_G007229 [Lachnellula subtilissima]
MPALPNNKTRRKGVTPIKKPDRNNVWQRTLNVMGLEPISLNSSSSSSSNSDYSTNKATADGMAEPTSQSEPTQGSKKNLTFLDLPAEAQRHIIKHSSTDDLLALCLVSKHFRDLAAEQLYRKFEVTFPDEPDDGTNTSVDALAGGLETLVSSNYDYAKYLKDIVLEPTNGGDKGERAYRYYMYDSSCGKFMNTLFLLALRKARVLETFKWDIRVELSPSVFKALHRIHTLQHLHVRMQAGHSLYGLTASSSVFHYAEAPPVVILPLSNTMGAPPGFAQPSSHNAPPLSVTYPSNPNSFPSAYKYAAKLQRKTTKIVLPSINKEASTLSGFNHLRTLSVLDMDTLDYIGELQTCIRNCSSTLTSLTLSFSEALASKSRKPPPEVHSDDDSEVEDEFGALIPPPGPPPGMAPSSSDLSSPSKSVQAAEEKKKQEDVLNIIFGLQTSKKSKPGNSESTDLHRPKSKTDEDPKLRFLRNYGSIAQKLMSDVKPGSEATPAAKQAVDLIKKAAKIYFDEVDKAKEKASSDGNSSKGTPSTTSADSTSEVNVVMSGGGVPDDEPGLFDDHDPNEKHTPYVDPEVANPDDIDMEEPEENELAIEIEDPSTDIVPSEESLEETASNESGDAETTKVVDAQEEKNSANAADLVNRLEIHEQLSALIATHSKNQQAEMMLKQRMLDMQEKLQVTDPTPAQSEVLRQAKADFMMVTDQVSELAREMQAVNDTINDVSADAQAMALEISGHENARRSEYVRSTRGLILQTLAIYLIPTRSMVLNTAIDFHVLQSLTLLNVGTQVGIWNTLRKENTLQSLPLSKIYTDNVTPQFLQFVGELDMVTELLLLEKQKGRVEPTAAKTTVKIEKIRKEVLKKHASTLKVLMIKNDSNQDWDLDVKTTMLLCHRAKQLEELSVSHGVRTLHCFLQFMTGMTSLRALHVNQFRYEDPCTSMMHEFKQMMVDVVAHTPHMKLEYIGLNEAIDRLVRRPRVNKNMKKDKKGKGKETDVIAEALYGDNGWADPSTMPDWQASSDEDEAVMAGESGLKVETVEDIRFYEISGVRIFEKDVIFGRL